MNPRRLATVLIDRTKTTLRKSFASVATVALLGISIGALAQSDQHFAEAIAEYPDLRFPAAPRPWGPPSREGNDIFKPVGEGPFPTVVLTHTCGGIEPHIYDRARELIDAGFAVLVLDAYTVRRHFTYCRPSGVKAPRLFKDTFDALAHLKQLPDIDASRIYQVGFSLGSFAASVAASPRVAQLVGSGHRFTASVGWYGQCVFKPFRGPEWELVRTDTDRPLLLLLAGRDRETPIANCFPLVENLKKSGKPVHWHVYPEATHAFDKENPHRGYRLDRAATRDAMRRTIDFLNEHRP